MLIKRNRAYSGFSEESVVSGEIMLRSSVNSEYTKEEEQEDSGTFEYDNFYVGPDLNQVFIKGIP